MKKLTEVTEKPSSWKTFQGKEVSPDSIDHQHLSNVYWFGVVLFSVKYVWVLDILKEKFNGQLLPYRPHISFTQEIEYLENHGHLVWNTLQNTDLRGDVSREGIITWNGNRIGEVIIPV